MSLDTSYLSASDGTGDASLMHITANRLVGATTLTVDTTTGVPSKFIATTGTLLASGFIDPTTITQFYGHLGTGNLVIDGFCPGSTDTGNSSGQVVVIKPNTHSMNLIANFITGIKTTVLGYVYPVGSIYINATDATNPATLLGFGTWVAWGAGRVPVGFDSGETEFNAAEKTGGEKTHLLTSGESGLPAHNHGVTDPGHGHAGFSNGSKSVVGSADTYAQLNSGLTITGTVAANSTTGISIQNNGAANAGAAHNNLQPYITVYMWKRTA